jgi:predicted nucleic acid-binding protein
VTNPDGLLLAARLDGKIASLRQEVDRLEAAGFRVAPELIERLLWEAGEAKAQ